MKSIDIKREFPLFIKQRYLNFGSSGPMPMTTIRKMHSHLLKQAQIGPSSPEFMKEYLLEYVRLKELLSSFLNVSDKEIGITQNTTEGINIILRGLKWKKGDIVITTNLEHAGLKIPLENLKRDYSVKIKAIKTAGLDQDAILERLKENMNSRVKLVALSHIDYITGRRLPIKRISDMLRRYKALLLVDGAQAVGAIPVDLRDLGCDFYSFPSHKWLLGPHGIGCLYVAKRRLNMVKPVFTGWCSVNDIEPSAVVSVHKKPKGHEPSFNLVDGAGRFAVSTWNLVGVTGFLESLSFFKRSLEGRMEERLNEIVLFKRRLREIPGITMITPLEKDDSGAIISFRLKEASTFEMVRKLIAAGFIIRYIPESDCARCSLGVVNTISDMEFFINRLKKIVKSR